MKTQLKKGNKIDALIGGQIEIIEKLGEGGQGIVYRVLFHGKEYALKWYKKKPTVKFYNNLKKIIQNGAPTPAFLCPLYLTQKDKEGHFGYLMELRDNSYVEFSDFLLAKHRFQSVTAMINAALNICNSFKSLHNKGYSYQDINDGNFFINPKTGDVLICDNDNIAPYGENLGIAGKCRYMAPEVVLGKNKPNAQSDRFSLSVILFMIFFNNHPLEGKMITSCPCLTEEYEKKFYGSEPIFIYDKNKDTNRPVLGIHANVIKRWSIFPDSLKEIFIEAFSEKSMANPNERMLESTWLKIFSKLRDDLICCSCGNETFIKPKEEHYTCIGCKKSHKRPLLLETENRTIALSKDKTIYSQEQVEISIGSVVENKKYAGVLGLKNLTENTWFLTTKDSTQRSILKNDVCPLLIGNKINIGDGLNFEIV